MLGAVLRGHKITVTPIPQFKSLLVNLVFLMHHICYLFLRRDHLHDFLHSLIMFPPKKHPFKGPLSAGLADGLILHPHSAFAERADNVLKRINI